MRNNNDGCLPFFIIGMIVGFIGVEVHSYITTGSNLVLALLQRM